MIITICGSCTFAEEMGKAADHLKKKGFVQRFGDAALKILSEFYPRITRDIWFGPRFGLHPNLSSAMFQKLLIILMLGDIFLKKFRI